MQTQAPTPCFRLPPPCSEAPRAFSSFHSSHSVYIVKLLSSLSMALSATRLALLSLVTLSLALTLQLLPFPFPNPMAATKSKILFIGGTGYIGKFIVEASAKAGHPTYALVREPTLSNPAKAKVIENFKSLGVNFVLVCKISWLFQIFQLDLTFGFCLILVLLFLVIVFRVISTTMGASWRR